MFTIQYILIGSGQVLAMLSFYEHLRTQRVTYISVTNSVFVEYLDLAT